MLLHALLARRNSNRTLLAAAGCMLVIVLPACMVVMVVMIRIGSVLWGSCWVVLVGGGLS